MTQARLSMRKLREIARLRFEAGRTLTEISKAAGVSRSTVQLALSRMQGAGLGWPWPEQADEAQIEARLYASPTGPVARAQTPEPDFARLQSELGRKGVTRRLLWREYRQEQAQGLSYSQFCERYRCWQGKQGVVLRQGHAPGEQMYVDYAGLTMSITDRLTGEASAAQIFVATLGHSSYTYAEATRTQGVVGVLRYAAPLQRSGWRHG